jgi:hypothetical protein
MNSHINKHQTDSTRKSFTACSPVTITKRGSNLSNPVVAAMLNSNMMNDCNQVREMLDHCMLTRNESALCSTAVRYARLCFGGTDK